MSHPDQPTGGGRTATISKPQQGDSLAEFATAHGLTQSAARPKLRVYLQDVWSRRQFIWAFASAKNISLYTDAKLGQVWQVLTPLLNAGVYYLIFGVLLGTSRGLPDFIPFLVAGVFLFGFTQRSIQTGAKSVYENISLIRALHFPKATLPLSYAIIELQQLLLSMIVLIGIVLAFGEPIGWHMLLIVPILVMQLIFNVGISLAMARVGAFSPDFNQLLPFLLRTWLYFSGVIFSVASLKQDHNIKSHPWIGKLLEINPGYVYPELARRSLLGEYRHYVHAPAHYKVVNHVKTNIGGLGEGGSLHLWVWAVVWMVVMVIGGFLYFFRAEDRYGRG